MAFTTVIEQAKSTPCIIYRTNGRIRFDSNGAVCAEMVKCDNKKWAGRLFPDHACKSERTIVGTKTHVANRCLRFAIEGEFYART